MNPEQIAIWFFGLTAAHFYQLVKRLLGLGEKVALWGLFAYAFVVAVVATLIGGSRLPHFTDPLLFLQWLGTHVGPIVALATLLYKGFGKTDEDDKFTPGLAISRFG